MPDHIMHTVHRMSRVILFSLVLAILFLPQTAFASGWSMAITDITASHKVGVGKSLSVEIQVNWSGLENIRQDFRSPYSVRIEICEGLYSDAVAFFKSCNGIAYGPSSQGETVSASGSKTYSIQLDAPDVPQMWHLTAFFEHESKTLGWAIFTYHPELWREFDVEVTDKFTLTVETEPGRVAVPILVDGISANTDAQGHARFEVSMSGSHSVQVAPEISTGTGTKFVFVRWSDGVTSNSRTIALTDDTTFTAQYKTQYILAVDSTIGAPQGGGWYDEGSSATFSVTSYLPVDGFMGVLGGKYVFDHWSGDSTVATPTASVTMDKPKTVKAEWRTDYTMPYIIIGAVVAAIAIIVALLLMRRRRAPTPTPAYPPPAVAAPPPPTVAMPSTRAAQPLTGKFCVNCGAPLPVRATFCNKCGTKQ